VAFTVSVGEQNSFASSTATTNVTLTSVSAGDLIVIGIYGIGTLRGITSVTITSESDATTVQTFETNSTDRYWFGYLLNVSTGGNKTITVTLDGTVTTLGLRAMALTPDVGIVTYDSNEVDASGTSTSATVSLTTPRDNSFIWAIAEAQGSPITPGGAYTGLDGTDATYPALYDLDGSTAGARAVDFTQSSADWAIGAISFSHGVDFSATGSGAGEGTGAATVTSTVGLTGFAQTGSGAGEGTGTADSPPVTLIQGGPGAASFGPMVALGTGEHSPTAHGRGYFEAMTAEGTADVPFVGEGAAEFEPMFGAGYGPNSGAGLFEALTASGVAVAAGVGAASFEPLVVEANAGYASFMPLVAAGLGQEEESEVYDIKVVNLRTGAVTEFTNHRYNSFARIGTEYYAAGPAGLVRLSGTIDPNTTNIDWQIKTGQMDDKNPDLKRLPEVLLGLRSNERVVVTIHPNDVTSYDYNLPVVKKTTIHQHRVTPGKGMRSRYYAVGLRGKNNATLELDSMQVNFTKTTRRLG